MPTPELFDRDPRTYAYMLIEDGSATAEGLLRACLAYLSHDQVREVLDANELSPRFSEEAWEG